MTKIHSTFLASLAGIFLLNSAIVCAQGAKIVLGTKVEKHVMQNERDHFAFHDGQVWAQIELKPSTDGDVTFVWTRDGQPYGEFKTATKQSDRYRTQSFVTARPGKWHVAVKSQENVVLAEKAFVVDGAASVDGSMASTSQDAKRAPKAKEKIDSKKVSGINDALKAMNPTNETPSVKADEKSPAKPVEAKPVDVKAPETKADAKKDLSKDKTKAADKAVDVKPVEAKPVDTKAPEAKADLKKDSSKDKAKATDKPVDAKPAEVKPADAKVASEKAPKGKADEKPASPKA